MVMREETKNAGVFRCFPSAGRQSAHSCWTDGGRRRPGRALFSQSVGLLRLFCVLGSVHLGSRFITFLCCRMGFLNSGVAVVLLLLVAKPVGKLWTFSVTADRQDYFCVRSSTLRLQTTRGFSMNFCRFFVCLLLKRFASA